MKIVNLDQFLAMPPGTVFAKYVPCIFEDLMIKGDTLPAPRDFCYQDIIQIESGPDSSGPDALFVAENGGSVSLDLDCQGRDGCFEADQLFAVYEKRDVLQLIARLQTALIDSEAK